MEQQVERVQTVQTSNGTSIAGFVVSLVGLVIYLTPCIGTIPGLLLSVIGFLLSASALRITKSASGDGRGLALAGVICGGIPWLLLFLQVAACRSFLGAF